MEKVIYSKGGGLGVILDENDKEEEYFDPIEITVVNEILKPGMATTLLGLFIKPVEYVGILKNEESYIMVFKLGQSADLFTSKIYYSCFYWITENRIANKYKEGTVRDYKWINNKWK